MSEHQPVSRASTWIALVAIAGVVLVVLIAVLGARRFAEERIEDNVRATLERTSSFASIAASENIDRLVAIATNAASDPDLVRELDGPRRRAMLDEVAARLRQTEGVRVGFVVAPDSTVLGMDPVDESVIGVRYADRDWYRGVQRTSPYLSEAYEIAAFDKPRAVTIAAQVRSGERVVGIITLVVETQRLGRAIDRAERVEDSPSLAIIDQSGGLVAGHEVDADSGAALVERRDIRGTGGWQVVAAVDRDIAYADLVDVRRAASALMFVVCALLLVLATILLLNVRHLARARREAERQAQAFELNDTIVQRLVVAKMALSLGQSNVAIQQLDAAIASARRIIGELAEGRDDFVRDVAAVTPLETEAATPPTTGVVA